MNKDLLITEKYNLNLANKHFTLLFNYIIALIII